MSFPRRVKFSLLALIVVVVVAPAAWRMLNSEEIPSIFNDHVPSAYGKIWTITGSADSLVEAFVDTCGSFQPTEDSYSFHYLIYDRSERKLYSPHVKEPEKISRGLLNGYLPAPKVIWEDGGVAVESVTFAMESIDSPGSDICYSSVTVKNTSAESKDIALFVAAVNIGIHGKYGDSRSIAYEPENHLLLGNGNVMLDCDSEPDAVGATGDRSRPQLRDITSYIKQGKLPQTRSARADTDRSASAALRYDLHLEPGELRKFVFRSPMHSVSVKQWSDTVSYSKAMTVFARRWSNELNRVKLELPDKRYADCFRASLAYLMILSDDGAPRPGATIYQPFWVRDFAYISDALYFAGRSDLLPGGFRHLRTLQRQDGGYSARTGGAADEYDAPGQAIYAYVQDYRRSGDIKQLAASWGSIKKACEYIRAKRLANHRTDDMRRGILPPSMSAEDLGKPNEQHYWDDFWAISGLKNAAYAADVLGYGSDAGWIGTEARVMQDALWGSIRAVAGKHDISYIPNGPEDVTTSAMARGTTSGLWPCGVLDPSDPFVRSSFDVYWDKWVAPYSGGLRHNGEEFWPYAGLDLAQCYLQLGQYDRVGDILRWSIGHDPTEGFYSWPEGMHMQDLTLANGDMPHGWMCASYILLLRNTLVRESGDDLIIASGVPEEWLDAGKEIRVRDFPTVHGKVSYRIRSTSDKILMTLDGQAQPRSYVFVPPKIMAVTGLVVDGSGKSLGSGDKIVVPAGARRVEIRVSR